MKRRVVNGRWQLWVPDSIAEWDAPTGEPSEGTGWEYVRFRSYRERLRWTDTFFDVGAEHGWISAILGQEFVDPARMHLFEPTTDMWSNIRATWEYNGLADPAGCIYAFVADHSDLFPDLTPRDQWVSWPNVEYGVERGSVTYASLALPGYVHSVSLDDYVTITGKPPDAISIDVEGAEMLVLRGAERLLRTGIPRNVWVSIHPDMLERDYHSSREEVLDYMGRWDYEHTFLGVDHEEHHLFSWNPF